MNPVYKKILVLIHNGKPICESLIILQYIDEAWPASKRFLPSHPYDHALARFWANFVEKKIYEVVSRIIRSNGDALEEVKHDIFENLEHLEGALKHMSKGGPYFGGEEFGFMDIVLIPFAAWFHTNEIIGNFKLPFSLLHAWVTKCMERDNVKKIVPTP
ncbi:hypothetical protein KI387_034701 [Taxus chinensis]|uniref:glutathione transferase n=1 Tax=Taxus chinensis TaxID=29808 RepID=A0AA38C5E0_TAXCH|nr:hypothetical protein KI387_034701 [Taxus chinensis]